MLYPDSLEQKLGFDKVRSQLEAFCESNLGQHFVQKLQFLKEKPRIEQRLAQTDEFVRLIESDALFPHSNYIDIAPYFKKIRIEKAYLLEEEFFEVILTLKTLNHCLDFFRVRREAYPVLTELTYPVIFDENLLWRLDKVFDERGNLKDNASDRLYEIRKEIAAEKQRLRNVLDRMMAYTLRKGYTPEGLSITIRNGRMVIPLFAEHKRRIKGLVHGQSATGQTVYLEPTEVFEINNQVQELEYAAQREVVRILLELTDHLRPELENLEGMMQYLGLIDFIRAKARFARAIRACKPRWSENRGFAWQNARHPILQQSHKASGREVVPLEISLTVENRILLISGPNAGGKSVCLKTVGLLQYMFQCGLLVSVDETSTFGLFEDLFIDIGDEQSIENDLSTYSSHLINMKYFLSHVNKKSLFLIDEFGTGTEPQYGGAMAEAMLTALNASKGMGVITTHYGNLKAYAEEHAGLINGAMRYDLKNLRPLYVLETGRPGSSFALEIAGKIGLPQAIIELARQKMGVKQASFDQMLAELQMQKQETDQTQQQIKQKESQLNELTVRYQQLKLHLEKQEKKILNEAKGEAKEIIKAANKEVEKAIREIKEQKADKQAVKQQRKQLEAFTHKHKVDEGLTVVKIKTEQINVGDYVRVKGQETVAQVISVKAGDVALRMGSLTSLVKLDRLEKVAQRSFENPVKPRKYVGLDYTAKKADFSSDIDLHGLRAEEVIPVLSKWLDDAILLGADPLRILHGKGNGVLRKVTRDYLATCPEVRSFEDEYQGRGDAGVTVVHLI